MNRKHPKQKMMIKGGARILAAVLLAGLVCGCGPEPGREGAEGADGLFAEGAGNAASAESTGDFDGVGDMVDSAFAGDAESSVLAGSAGYAAPSGDRARVDDGATGLGGSQASTGDAARLSGETLADIEAFLNEDDSYGFLLSSYETPADIDLNQVFWSGAGFAQEPLEDKEASLLLARIPQKEIRAPVVKVTEDQVASVLAGKTGMAYEEFHHPLADYDDWAHIGRYHAWYALRDDTNRRFAACSDAWQQGNDIIVHFQLLENAPAANAASPAGDGREKEEGKNAVYRPTYEARLQKDEDGYRFFSNTLWVQKDLIEAQSYRADLSPAGEVFFAPFYPDTGTDPRADVTFALVKDHALLASLAPMEKGNVRSDRIFTGVEAVDFTDYNKDGCTDILAICSYTLAADAAGTGKEAGEAEAAGKAGTAVREARVYTGQKDGVPYLDMEKTRAVNRHVQTLGITGVTAYLTGASDGSAEKYSSWKEAFADHVRHIDPSEYAGFALIYLNDDRTPELVQIGATTAKGATIFVYRNGRLEETWLNRRIFAYLEYENLLYSPSGVDNLHYDTIYSIVSGRLSIAAQGYYGNSRFARVQVDEEGRESYDYYWDGGKVSARGYRDGLRFVFDGSRARTCGVEDAPGGPSADLPAADLPGGQEAGAGESPEAGGPKEEKKEKEASRGTILRADQLLQMLE